MYLYHYSPKKLDQILTLELQDNYGIRTLSESFINKEINASKFRGEKYSRLKEISLMIDKLPINMIRNARFPKAHPYKKAKTLFCHSVEIKSLDNILKWELTETPFDVFLRDHFWMDYIPYKFVYFRIRELLKFLKNEKGRDVKKLSKQASKYKNTYDKYFKDWIDSESFERTNNMYACGVPHILVYTNQEIRVFEVKRIDMT